MTAWTYRPGLDGLRAVAVYLVLGFHAGIGVLRGGFVGVDLFFVLSGFLVATILLRELESEDGVRLWAFYGRRVRRLLPAALLAITATSVTFVLIASSARRVPLIGDAQASTLYVANWRFLREQSDYFAADSAPSPFLHFWSLSIEEQFYIGFPLLLLLLWRWAKVWQPALVVGLAALFACSLASQLWWARSDENHAYYGTDARAYQLLAGAVLALYLLRRARRGDAASSTSRRTVGAFSLTGSAALAMLLLIGSAAVDTSASTRGLAATVAALLLILSVMRLGDSGLARLLGAGAPAYLGRISYGTYLWHWPVILVLREVLDANPWTVAALAAVLATALAALSYELLEQPIRTGRVLRRRPVVSVAGGIAASLVVALVVAPPVLGSERRPVLAKPARDLAAGGGRPVPQGVSWWTFNDDTGPEDTACTPTDLDSCVVRRGDSGLDVMLVGDSHARMLAPTIESLADEHDFTLSLNVLVGCPWQREVLKDVDGAGSECGRNREDVYDTLLAALDVDVVILAQQPRDRGKYYAGAAERGLTEAEFDQFNYASVERTLTDIEAQGARAVMVEPMLMIPEDRRNPLECLSDADRTDECVVPTPLEPAPSASWITSLGLLDDDADSITINDLMCPAAPLCDPLVGRVPVWLDRHHFTPAAIEAHSEEIWDRLVATGSFSE